MRDRRHHVDIIANAVLGAAGLALILYGIHYAIAGAMP